LGLGSGLFQILPNIIENILGFLRPFLSEEKVIYIRKQLMAQSENISIE
jgi:hypothetical protein